MSDPTRDWKTVRAGIWNKMMRLAFVLDVEKGGLYDARSGCINVWVSPEDHPPCWDGIEITAGAYPAPRGYLGGIMAEWTDDFSEAILTLELTPYDRMPERQVGSYPPPEEDEWQWIATKAQHLLDLAERIIEPPGAEDGIFCKYCEAPVKVALLNDFLDHLVALHNVQVLGVHLGVPTLIMTPTGPIEV